MRESRHKIDELEEKAALVDPVRANAQETELRDLRCKVEELQAGCDDRTLQVNPHYLAMRIYQGYIIIWETLYLNIVKLIVLGE